MAAKQKPYDQYGPFILFKKLESDALGDLWRAARLEANGVSTTVALRRLTGGQRDALGASATVARQVAPLLTGPSFVRSQSIDLVNGVVCISHEYSGGRSLRHVVDRARGGAGANPNPIPIDQAIVITEKVALSLATIAELRFSGERLAHGCLLPQFVWISDDGEIRVAAQQLGKGLVASLKEPKVGAELSRYFSPEYQHSGQVTKASEVYSVGALLFLVVTGQEPPDASTTSAFASAIRAAKTMAGTPIPDDIRSLLEKSLNLDPAVRFASVTDMKNALSALTAKYGATSFNLAFYLSSLLKKEFESEAADRERESQVNIGPYLDAFLAPAPQPAAAPIAAAPAPPAAPFASVMQPPKKSKAPVAIAAAVALAVIGGGAWFVLGSKKVAPSATPNVASVVPVPAPKPAPVIPAPLVASPAGQTTSTAPATDTAATATMDEAAKKKAFEDAVNQKLHEEMMKLQSEYTKSLQQQQSKNAPVTSSAPPTPAVTTAAAATAHAPAPSSDEPSAAQLDQQRRDSVRTTSVAEQAPPPVLQTAAPAVAQTQAVVAPPPAAPAVHEGDIIDYTNLDVAPRRTRDPRITYPVMAARQRVQATILTSVLISENGDVVDVKILRGDARYGFNDAAVSALKTAKYTPATKEGKRVKTWLPQMVQFKPQ